MGPPNRFVIDDLEEILLLLLTLASVVRTDPHVDLEIGGWLDHKRFPKLW